MRSSIRLIGLLLAILVLSSHVRAAQLHVGTAEVSITPDRPVALEGSFHLRISDGVQSPIVACVVVLESREGEKVLERSVMVSADLVHLPMEMVQAVRKKVAGKIPGIDPAKIFISTTHTHQAPVVMRDNFILPKDKGIMTVGEYIDFFVGRVSGGIVKAMGGLRPGSAAWGLGHAQVAYNRRTAYLDGTAQVYAPVDRANYQGPEGPEYQGIPVLFFFDQDGEPLAAAVNVWSPSQEAFGGNKISADFWHPVRERLKRTLGEDLVVLGWCGASGDQGPKRIFHQEAEERMRRLRGVGSWVDEFGRRIAGSVLDTYALVREDRHSDIVLVHRSEVVPLPGWKLTDEQITEIRGWRDAYAKELAADPESAPRLARPISWRTQTLERQEAFAKHPQEAYESEIHVLRIGDVAVCTNQFELYTEYGLRILGRSDAHLTCVVQLTGPAHYLPTANAMARGGYGARPESCAVGAEGGDALVNATVKHIDELFNPLIVTLPEEGQLKDGKPVGAGWTDLLADVVGWVFEPDYWKLSDGALHGESTGGDHHFAWTKSQFRDFEAHAVVKMTGAGANSGVGIRLQPKSSQEAPGYQVDMGPGYWGCLWEEGGDGMVQQYRRKDADKLVRHAEWNHYYIVARGHHIQAWLNGVKTIDIVHESGSLEGSIGFELCHGEKHTILDVKTLAVRELEHRTAE